jgi:putative membrane protein
MSRIRSSATIAATTLAALAVVLGCKPATPDADPSTGAAVSAADTSAAPAPAPAPAPAAGLSDANIVALLDEANKADSAAGAFARTKATDADVKAFAQLMITEHHLLRAKGQELAKKLNITPALPADDAVRPAAQAEMESLRSASKGSAFDRTYIDHEVAMHKAVLDLAGQAHGATQNAELKALIQTAKPYIERHLERAESIQKKIGKPVA